MVSDNRIFIYLPGSTSLIQSNETDVKVGGRVHCRLRRSAIFCSPFWQFDFLVIAHRMARAQAATELLNTAAGNEEVLFCHIEGGLIYAAAGQVKSILTHKLNVLSTTRKIRKFIFDLRSMSFSDSTALKALIGLVEDLEARGMRVCIVGPPKGLLILMPHSRVSKKFRNVQLFDDMADLNRSGWISEIEVAVAIQGHEAAHSDLVTTPEDK